MEEQIKLAIKRFREAKEILIKFKTKEEAVEYLVKETGISKEECLNACDILMKMNLDK